MDQGQHYQGERYRALAGPGPQPPMQPPSAIVLGEPQYSPGQPGASPGSASVHVWDDRGPALAQALVPIQILTAPCVNLESIPLKSADANRKYLLGWLAG